MECLVHVSSWLGGGQTDTLTSVFIAWLRVGRRRYNHCVEMLGPEGGMNSQGLQVDPGGHDTLSGSERLMNGQAEKPYPIAFLSIQDSSSLTMQKQPSTITFKKLISLFTNK